MIQTVSPTVATDSGPERRQGGRRHTLALFVVLSVAYYAVGHVLMLRYNIFEWDGISRVANTGYALMSRDPHVAAIGFVWNPLPSLVQIPLLPLSHWWPELKTHGLAGFIQSAVFMSGAALMVRQIAIDRHAGVTWQWVAVACFALNPMIVLYGASGMSEASEIFCLVWCARYLLRWIDSQHVGDLAWAGIALAFGYLTRYEIAPAAAGAAALVALVAFMRAPRETRNQSTVLSVAIVAFPTAAAFAIWALTGWIVSGELFATISSQYGNANQVAMSRAHGDIADDANWSVIAERLFGMQPFVGIALILAVTIWVLTRRFDTLVPVSIFGSALAFAMWGHYTGATYSLFRYYLPAVPLVVIIALACWPSRRDLTGGRAKSISRQLGTWVLGASLIVGIPVSGWSMFHENNSGQMLLGMNSLVDPVGHPPAEEFYRRAGIGDRLLADYLDKKNLPAGSVLTDSFVSTMVWLASDNPKQFIVTSDYDFTAALNRPWESGVKYILISNPATNAAVDALTKRYPSLWADGAGIGTRVYSVDGPDGRERWRVYRVDPPSPELSKPRR